MIQVASDHHQLVLANTSPIGVVDGKALSSQVEHMTALTLLEPEDPLGAENLLRQLVIEKVLKLAQGEGPITLKGQ